MMIPLYFTYFNAPLQELLRNDISLSLLNLQEDDVPRFGEFNKVGGPKNNPWLCGIQMHLNLIHNHYFTLINCIIVIPLRTLIVLALQQMLSSFAFFTDHHLTIMLLSSVALCSLLRDHCLRICGPYVVWLLFAQIFWIDRSLIVTTQILLFVKPTSLTQQQQLCIVQGICIVYI